MNLTQNEQSYHDILIRWFAVHRLDANDREALNLDLQHLRITPRRAEQIERHVKTQLGVDHHELQRTDQACHSSRLYLPPHGARVA
jgi:predicted flavoprotein YhiN